MKSTKGVVRCVCFLGLLSNSAFSADFAVNATGAVEISFETTPGKTYQLQRADTLDQPVWMDYGQPHFGDGTTQVGFVSASLFPTQFFQVAEYDLNDGLILHLPFSGDANDASGNGYNGDVFGSVLTTDRFSQSDRAYYFDGEDDYIRLMKLLPDMPAFSVSVWFQYLDGSFQDGRGDIFNDSDTSGGLDFQVAVVNGTTVGLVPKQGSGSGHPFGRDVTMNWQHLVWTADEESQRAYLNGQLFVHLEQGAANSSLHALPVIGASTSLSPMAAFFKGKIDDLRVYDRAVSITEVQMLFRE